MLKAVAGGTGGSGVVTSFNSRTGAVTLTSGDVTTALAYTPLNPANNLSDVNSAATSRTNLGAASLGANTFTGLQTITQASANTGILASTGYSLTGSDQTSMVNLAGTWNTSGVPVAIKLAITNTAAGANPMFMQFLGGAAGTTEYLRISSVGSVISQNTLASVAGNLGVWSSIANAATGASTGNYVNIRDTGIDVRSDYIVAWSNSTSNTTTKTSSISQASAARLQLGDGAANANGSLNLTNLTATGAAIILSGVASDAAATDTTLCQKSSDGTVLKGSGTLGICLGTSGRQFKTDFAPMTAGLSELMQLPLYNYHYLPGHGDGGRRMQYGLTAQDVEKVMPTLAGHNANGETINYDYGALLFVSIKAIQELEGKVRDVPVLIEAIRDQQIMIDELQNRLDVH